MMPIGHDQSLELHLAWDVQERDQAEAIPNRSFRESQELFIPRELAQPCVSGRLHQQLRLKERDWTLECR
jgi:hypothetical protein